MWFRSEEAIEQYEQRERDTALKDRRKPTREELAQMRQAMREARRNG